MMARTDMAAHPGDALYPAPIRPFWQRWLMAHLPAVAAVTVPLLASSIMLIWALGALEGLSALLLAWVPVTGLMILVFLLPGFRKTVLKSGPMASPMAVRRQLAVNRIWQSWASGVVPTRVGLAQPVKLTADEERWLERNQAQAKAQGSPPVTPPVQYPTLRSIKAGSSEDMLVVTLATPPSQTVDQILDAAPALARLWQVSLVDRVPEGLDAVVTLSLSEKAGWAR